MEVTFNRQTIISFPENQSLPDIEHGIADGSLYIDEVLFTDRFTVGECNANQFEVEVYDYPTVSKGELIYVYQIVDEVEGEEPIEVPLFTGYVDECVVDRGRFEDSKKITAYDVLYEKGGDNVAKWWAGCFETVNHVSVKTLRDSLFAYLEIDCEDVELPNDSVQVTYTQKTNNISFSSALKYLMLINGANAKVDRSGVVRFITISDDEPIEIDSVYAQNTSEFDTYTIPAYAGVRITNTTKNISILAGEEYNVLEITDNLFLLKQAEPNLDLIAQNILNAIKNITYKPAQIDMIYSQLDITVGNKVKIGLNEYLVCENTLSGSLLVDQHISSTGANAFEESSGSYDATQKEMQEEISASSLKYYRAHNDEALTVYNEIQKQIISIRYSVAQPTIVTLQGAVILDVDVIDETEPAIVELQYSIDGVMEEVFKPTETYLYHEDTQRHTINLLHFWEHTELTSEFVRVYMRCTNCNVNIGAYREEFILSGMGLVGETVWTGWIEVRDRISGSTFSTEPAVDEFDSTPEITLHDNILIQIGEEVSVAEIKNEPNKVDKFYDGAYVNKKRLKDFTWEEVLNMGTWQNVLDEANW